MADRAYDLKPCPWCGRIPTMRPWHGGGPLKRMVHCVNERCRVAPEVTGARPSEAADIWNDRAD